MGVRFRRSASLGGGVRLNLSKSGIGLSVGREGARIGIGPRGAYTSVGIPGTGLYAMSYLSEKTEHSANDRRKASRSLSDQVADYREIREQYPDLGALGLPQIHVGRYLVAALIAFVAIPGVAGMIVALAICGLWLYRWNSAAIRLSRKYVAARDHAAFRRFEEAARGFEELREDIRSSLLSLALGHTYYLAGNYDRALAAYLDYLDRGPSDVQVTLRCIGLLSAAGKFEDLLRLAESLPREAAREPSIILERGRALLETGRAATAIEVLKTAPLRQREADSVLTEIRFLLGRAYEVIGKPGLAMRAYGRVYADDPQFPEAKEALARLESSKVGGQAEAESEDDE